MTDLDEPSKKKLSALLDRAKELGVDDMPANN